MPKYSVVIPFTDEQKSLRAEASVFYADKPGYVQTIPVDGSKTERIIARNKGMQLARGEWICWLDSDDLYSPVYFEKVDQMIEERPGAKCFNFATLVYHQNIASSIRQAFKPQELGLDSFVGANFKSGRISTGAFVFKRDILDEIGYLPEATFPYGNPDSFSAKCSHPLYQPNENGQWPPMGNPFGDDFFFFHMITRKYDSVPYDIALYIQNVRK